MIVLEIVFLVAIITVALALLGPILARLYEGYLKALNNIDKESQDED